MGTGASKEETQSKDGPNEDFSPSRSQSTQKFRQKSEPRTVVSPKDAQQVKSSTDDRGDTRQTSILKRQKAEENRTIVGLIDSDEDEDEAGKSSWGQRHPKPRPSAVSSLGKGGGGGGSDKSSAASDHKTEKRLKKDLRDLEKTFAAIEIHDDHLHDTGALTMSQLRTQLKEGQPSQQQMVEDYQQDLHRNSSSRQKHQIKALKFSWQIEDKQNDNLNGQKNYVDEDYKDEWTYKKTVIEGFDPDKFRQVNQHQPLHQNVHSPVLSKKSSRVFRHQNATDNSETGFDHHQLIPGAVPTYDMSEKQLLAALEQELGVL